MPAPTIYQNAYHDNADVFTNSTTIDATSQIPIASDVVAGRSIIVFGIGSNLSALDTLPVTVNDNLGNNYTTLYEYVTDTSGTRTLQGCWHAKNINGGTLAVTVTLSNGRVAYWHISLLEVDDCDPLGSAFTYFSGAPSTSHQHSDTPITTSGNVLAVMCIEANNNMDWVDAVGSALPGGYNRHYSITTRYYRRFAQHWHPGITYTADNIPITAAGNQNADAFVQLFETTGPQPPQPPVQDTTTPNFTINQGATGTIRDVSGDWSVGTGGTGPLEFSATNFDTGFSITLTGQIQSDGSPALGDYTLQEYSVDDAANNGPTASNTFTITVQAVSGTLTTPILQDDQGNTVTGRTGITFTVEDATATGAPVIVHSGSNQAQEPDGTFIVSDVSLTAGNWYILKMHEPNADPGANPLYRGVFLLQAT